MLTLGSNTLTAIAKRKRALRQLAYFWPADRATGTLHPAGFWTGQGTITTNVIDGLTGSSTSRDFMSAGAFQGLDEIPMSAGLEVREITISMSQVSAQVADAIRLYDLRLARAEVYFGWLDVDTKLFTDPPRPLVVGVVTGAPIVDREGGGGIEVRIVSQLRELTRENPAKRDGQSQRLRLAGDTGYDYAAVVDRWKIPWGTTDGQLLPAPQSDPVGKPAARR